MLKNVKSAKRASARMEELPTEVLPESQKADHEAPAQGDVIKDERPGDVGDKSETDKIEEAPGTEAFGEDDLEEGLGEEEEPVSQGDIDEVVDLIPEDPDVEYQPEIEAIETLQTAFESLSGTGSSPDLILHLKSQGLLSGTALSRVSLESVSTILPQVALEEVGSSLAERAKALIAKASARVQHGFSTVIAKIEGAAAKLKNAAVASAKYVKAHPGKSFAIAVGVIAAATTAVIGGAKLLEHLEDARNDEMRKKFDEIFDKPLGEAKKAKKIIDQDGRVLKDEEGRTVFANMQKLSVALNAFGKALRAGLKAALNTLGGNEVRMASFANGLSNRLADKKARYAGKAIAAGFLLARAVRLTSVVLGIIAAVKATKRQIGRFKERRAAAAAAASGTPAPAAA